ncbi:MAG: hypothetical protein COX57_05435 [Alphaproteobacteria bacterium CG_4_10_14_0_2_um_filter_63_37]|nr:MAG: hypothetical protein AUJ55_12355 [Proteobacteria bacterium CG1_02_64_396]PJA25005.1 MAG: hypothetical protein COX57_05435 [Alphaproteobacteria bacterium CG_4_10_14_0_2_um_filter_63_37]
MSPNAKIFVLDTNVLIHDPNAIACFGAHEVILSIVVLEELDRHKRGVDEVARNARTATRMLDQLLDTPDKVRDGAPLPDGGILRVLLPQSDGIEGLERLGSSNDNAILELTVQLMRRHAPRPVILVSKDINLRLKARAFGIQAEDYRTDRVVDEDQQLYAGWRAMPEGIWEALGDTLQADVHQGHPRYRFPWPADLPPPHFQEFLIFPGQAGGSEFVGRITAIDVAGVEILGITDYAGGGASVWGIEARNREQNMLVNLLMDPDIDLVSILGLAGSGKTLLTLAAALEWTLEKEVFDGIVVTRATVPLGQELGFLPGDEEEKMRPWMGAVEDNLALLAGFEETSEAILRSRIQIKSMSFMRGRTFTRRIVIVDEAQNLTPNQMKSLITRVGQESRMIVLGNTGQIDTPYLSALTSGLAYVVERFKDWPHAGHVTLVAGVRSRLAAFASEALG